MKFLMIDDSECKIATMKVYFTEHEFDTASSYISGMYKLIDDKYDGLILDMAFPVDDEESFDIDDTNGISVLRELKRKKINIPTIIFSSDTQDTSKYENVIDYILNNNCCIKDRVLNFIMFCNENC